jgi:hypothetical protein
MENYSNHSTWTAQKFKLKDQFRQLTDNDLNFEQGDKEAMIEHLKNKLGKSREEMHIILSAMEMSIQFGQSSNFSSRVRIQYKNKPLIIK